MKSIARHYTESLHDEFNYFGTWLPTVNLNVGDIGIIEGDEFDFKANLKDRGITFEVINDSSFANMEYSTKGGVSVSTKLSGQTPDSISSLAKADAGLVVDFTKENAILFKAEGTQTFKIKDQFALAEQVEELFEKGKWEKEWVIITELVKAKSATVLISSKKGAQIELKAKGEITTGAIDIAGADLGLEIKSSRNVDTKFVASKGLTPLFKASKIKKGLFAKGRLKSKGADVEKVERNGLGELSLEDL